MYTNKNEYTCILSIFVFILASNFRDMFRLILSREVLITKSTRDKKKRWAGKVNSEHERNEMILANACIILTYMYVQDAIDSRSTRLVVRSRTLCSFI